VLGLSLPRRLRVLCLGAHPDDIEIGCGGTLLSLAEGHDLRVANVVLTGSPARAQEAAEAARLFGEATVTAFDFPDGRLPAHWDEVKSALEQVATEQVASEQAPDLLLAPDPGDAHQDHRLVAQLVTTVWRDALVLSYEVPKWDGDFTTATHYVPLRPEVAHRKVELLHKAYPSQHSRDWWDEELFLGVMRLRGMECRSRYAEAFTVRKAVLAV
jgi:LmbE family N-acetylglucosaminyl deacetylase